MDEAVLRRRLRALPAMTPTRSDLPGTTVCFVYSAVVNAMLTEIKDEFETMTHPQPALSHKNYPFYTPGGRDRRWVGTSDLEEHGMHWVGGLLYIVSSLFDFEPK